MSRARVFLVVGLVVLLSLAGGAWWLTSRPADVSVVSGPSDAALATAAAAEATAGEGVAAISLEVTAEMPPDLDDGIPSRDIAGEGLANFEESLASVDYGMDDVPNSAGFFGHVSGDMSVVYEGSSFLVTFPVMADVLEGDLDWLSYQVSDFSNPRVLGAGIGQLREIGLADPRLGFALASSGAGGEPDPEGRLPIDLRRASDEVEPDIRPTIAALQELGVQQVLLATEVDEDGFLNAFSYELAYSPRGPATGARQVKISVSVQITETGVEEAVEVPPEPAVQPYLEYLEA